MMRPEFHCAYTPMGQLQHNEEWECGAVGESLDKNPE